MVWGVPGDHSGVILGFSKNLENLKIRKSGEGEGEGESDWGAQPRISPNVTPAISAPR